jgi:hypothetical protein
MSCRVTLDAWLWLAVALNLAMTAAVCMRSGAAFG